MLFWDQDSHMTGPTAPKRNMGRAQEFFARHVLESPG